MKGKRTSKSRIISLALAVVLLTSSLLSGGSLTAQAAGIEAVTPTTFVADEAGTVNIIYFGEYNGNPIKWRVLSTAGGELFLFSDAILDIKPYYSSYTSITWEGSEMRRWLNGALTGDFYTTAFSQEEQVHIKTTHVVNNNNPDHSTAGGGSTQDKVFLLSLGEAGHGNVTTGETALLTNNANRGSSVTWWLRSAGFFNYDAAFVWGSGLVDSIGDYVYIDYGIRPALKINLSSVIFSSSAAGGKSTQVGANLSAAQQPTAAIKLTVKDSAMAVPSLVFGETTDNTNTLRFGYTGAKSGEKQYLSCVLEQGGEIKYYGKLADCATSTGGVFEIDTSSLTPDTYTMKIFSEQANDDNYTDFASTSVDLTLVVDSGGNGTVTGGTSDSAIPTVNTVTPIGTAEPTSGNIVVTFSEAMNQNASVGGVSLNSAPALTGGSWTNPTTYTVPYSGLTTSTPYTVGISEFQDSAGNEMITNNANQFTTAEAPTVPTVTPTSLTLQEGTAGSFSVTMGTGTDKATSVAIVSSDTAVATVGTATLTANGTVTVTGVTEGTANINLTWTGGSKDGTTSTVAVTVNALPPNSYAVNFDPAGGTLVSGNLNQTVTHGSSATAPVVDRSGYTFDGWDKDFSNITTSIMVTAKWKQNPPAGINHTITLGASGNGTVTGSGSYAENDNITVTATPNAGWSFKQWTEGGTVVSQSASYSFTVTAARRLVAVFEEIPPTVIPEPPTVIPEPSTIVYPSGGGSSSSGGSKAPDKSTNTGGTTTGSTTSKPVTKQEAEKAVDNAIAQLPAGAKEVVVTLKNPSGISKEALDIITKKAAAAGVTPVVHLDTVVGGKVTGRITLRGGAKGFGVAAIDATFDLTRAQMIEKLFRKYFSNNLFAVCLNQQGELGTTASIAVPLPAGLSTENLVVYSYDSATNKYVKLATAVRVDSSGYVHFDTTIGGDFVVSDGVFVKK